MKNQIYKLNLLKMLISMLCLLIIAFAMLLPCMANVTPPLDRAGVIKSYIEFLADAEDCSDTSNSKSLHSELPGMGTDETSLPDMTLDEAEAQGLLSSSAKSKISDSDKAARYTAIAMQQHDLVIEQFGDDAWVNVSYTLEPIEPLDGALGFRIIKSGKLISEQEYEKEMRAYWEKIAQNEGVDYYDIFLRDDEHVENLQYKRVDLISEYSSGQPAELTLISESEAYCVNLKFNNQAESDEGYTDFHFIIDNRNGNWSVFSGLSWTAPYKQEPTSD